MRSSAETSDESSRICWWPAVVIALLGAIWFWAVQISGWRLTHPARDLAYGFALLNVAIYVWTRVYSGLNTRRQFTLVTIVVLVQLCVYCLVRIDGFAGDGRIVFQWRWTPTPEQQMAEFSPLLAGTQTSPDLSVISALDSPSFRGHERTGQIQDPDLQLDWNAHPPQELWRHPIGRGWSSFAVVGDYCVTQEQIDAHECVVCYELRTGKQVWQHRDKVRFNEVTSGAGPRATPAIADGRVYSFGATGILNCLDGSTGQLVWTLHLGKSQPLLFGHAGSPLVYQQYVYVAVGGDAGSVVAVDRESGKVAWTNGTRGASYSSPHLLTGRDPQILIFDATGLHGHDSASGDLRWSFTWGVDSAEQANVSQPVVLPRDSHSNQAAIPTGTDLIISSGYGKGTARISVHHDDADRWTVTEQWRTIRLKSKFSCFVVKGGFAFGLDEGILACISLQDGSLQWKKGRYGYGQLLLINDMLLVQSESGHVFLVEANPTRFREVATLPALNNRTWNHPVVTARHLLVRNDREAVCFELRRNAEDHSGSGAGDQLRAGLGSHELRKMNRTSVASTRSIAISGVGLKDRREFEMRFRNVGWSNVGPTSSSFAAAELQSVSPPLRRSLHAAQSAAVHSASLASWMAISFKLLGQRSNVTLFASGMLGWVMPWTSESAG